MASYQQRARGFVGMYALHFLLAGIAAFGSQALPSAAWAYAALAIYISLCLGILRTSPATFLLFVPLLANRATEFISGGAIESGAYMIETTTTGQPTGAFTRLLLIYMLFLLTATFAVEAMWPRLKAMFRDAPARWERQAPLIWKGLLAVVVVVSLYLIRLGINNGFPLFSGIDRFVYLEKLDSPLYQSWMSNRLVVVPFVGALFALPAYRARAGLVILWMLATSIIFGEKFGSLLMILSVFGIPAGLVHIANDRKIPFNFIAGVCTAIIVTTIPAVLIAYGALNDFDAAAERYGQRVALQGQLWYVTDLKYMSATNFDDRALAADMSTWFDPGAQESTKAGTRFGLYYVMQRFASSRLLGWTMEGGNGFIGSLYPYLLMTMGVVGMLILSSIIALYHAVVMRMLAASFAQSIWIAGLLYSRVMSSFYATYTTGYLWNIFGIKTIATLLVALFLTWEYGRSTSVSRRWLAKGAAASARSRRAA
ncbi:hypothetical protein J2Y58_003003 [Sphingomonas sp. BE138]|uniref:DUF6418 domain-containing protein n=1 Tax=Sphingomonas sp. BE138 TaxID=2817845 RepID=UPI002859FA31|nr:DUF6418 domain-containing protein [Sphingomonas sp. BE138]MDR6789630.1 hypothetical protein [Sphingomonas sp. BE138]